MSCGSRQFTPSPRSPLPEVGDGEADRHADAGDEKQDERSGQTDPPRTLRQLAGADGADCDQRGAQHERDPDGEDGRDGNGEEHRGRKAKQGAPHTGRGVKAPITASIPAAAIQRATNTKRPPGGVTPCCTMAARYRPSRAQEASPPPKAKMLATVRIRFGGFHLTPVRKPPDTRTDSQPGRRRPS